MTKALLRRVLEVQSASRNTERMTNFIAAYAIRHGMEHRIHEGNIYVTKGTADVYPCIVAHTDTVHNIVSEDRFTVMEGDGKFYGFDPVAVEFSGVGGDDKCGIYIALQLLTDLPACKAAFFRDEEIGCVGAGLADLTFFDDCAFALQADRRGHEDVVTRVYGVDMTSEEFNVALFPHMSKYHKRFERNGALTDVYTLKVDQLPVCAINASAGYHRPHMHNEYVDVAQVMQTKRFFRDICLKLGHKRWLHTAVEEVYEQKAITGKTRAWTTWDDDDYGYGRMLPAQSLVQTKLIDNVLTRIVGTEADLDGTTCPECYRARLYWDEAEQLVWCNGCADYAAVIVTSRHQALEEAPVGEGGS